jgi:hypothetical protein
MMAGADAIEFRYTTGARGSTAVDAHAAIHPAAARARHSAGARPAASARSSLRHHPAHIEPICTGSLRCSRAQAHAAVAVAIGRARLDHAPVATLDHSADAVGWTGHSRAGDRDAVVRIRGSSERHVGDATGVARTDVSLGAEHRDAAVGIAGADAGVARATRVAGAGKAGSARFRLAMA